LHTKEITTVSNFLPTNATPIKILITSGASCPDAVVEAVIKKLASVVGSDFYAFLQDHPF